MNAVIEATEKQLPEPVARRAITEPQWRTLTTLYPGANPQSVLLVWDYCVARKLDPMKKPCHIVPMNVKDARTGKYEWRDVVLPGVYELRTTAMRTGLYLGTSKPEYGPVTEWNKVSAPEWCDLTVYRWNKEAQMRCEFPVHILFREVVGLTKDGNVNDRWSRAPVQMLTKCAEAAALREGFPDELGGQHTVEEMEGRVIEESHRLDPRDGLDPVEFDKIETYVSRIADILDQDVEAVVHADQIFEVHREICTDADLYTAVSDALKNRKILTARQLKDTVELGSQRYQARNVRP